MNSGKRPIIPSGISVILIYLVGVIIGFLLPILIFFLFLLDHATIFWIVYYPARSMIYANLTAMVSFSIWFLVEFSIIMRSIHPIGDLMSPAVDLYGNSIFCLGECFCSLEFLYLSLKCKYWVFYLGVSLELNLILQIVIIYFYLIQDILGFQV